MHIHNRIDSPSLFLSPLLSQPAVLITQLRQVKEREETPDTREIYSQTSLFTPRQQSESQWSWHQRVMLAHPVPSSLCQGGLERKTPLLQTPRPHNTLHMPFLDSNCACTHRNSNTQYVTTVTLRRRGEAYTNYINLMETYLYSIQEDVRQPSAKLCCKLWRLINCMVILPFKAA